MEAAPSRVSVGQVLSKVPEVTLFFWIIKVLCTTIGETAADFLNVNLNLGLTLTSIVMGVLFVIALAVQFKTKKYTPIVYWITVVLISVFGTLVTDNLSDNLGVPLEFSTILFTGLLAITFALWYRKERTLSIHSIFTPRREAFYWLAILFTFALGTAAGDLMAEALGLGYLTTGIIVAVTIAVFAIGWRLGLNAILAFWFIYILTRPLGASLGDFLSQSQAHGGLGVGPTMTTVIFTIAIIATVIYLAWSRKDVMQDPQREEQEDANEGKGAFGQLAAVVGILLVLSVGGYYVRQGQLAASMQTEENTPVATTDTTDTNSQTPDSVAPTSGQTQTTKTATETPTQTQTPPQPTSPHIVRGPLGDLSSFTKTTQAILDAVNAGDWKTANDSADDIEYDWDNAEAHLKPMNRAAWTNVDDAIDSVLREIRAVHPNKDTSVTALQKLLQVIQNPS